MNQTANMWQWLTTNEEALSVIISICALLLSFFSLVVSRHSIAEQRNEFLFEKRLQIREYICAIYKLVNENTSLLNRIIENGLSDVELLGTFLTNDDLFQELTDGICDPEKDNKARKTFLKRRDEIKRQASEISFLFPTNLNFLKDIIKVYFDLLSAIMKRNMYVHSIHESYSKIPVSQRKNPEQMQNECENLQTNRDIIKYRDQLNALLQQSPLPSTLKLIDETIENG